MKMNINYNFLSCETLVISGSGIKGIGFIGILYSLIDKYKLNMENIKNYAGSSAGGLICTLLCFNMQPFDIFLLINKCLPFNIGEKEELYKILENIIGNITFKELYESKNLNLILTSYNMNENKPIYYNHIYYPNTSIISALKETINIPIFVSNENNIDGILCTPFPIKICKDLNYKNIIGIYSYSHYEPKLNIRNLYDDFINIFTHLINTLIKYETYFADENDLLINFSSSISNSFSVDQKIALNLFSEGIKFIN